MQDYTEKAAMETKRGVPWTLWLSSGLVISVILIGSMMLTVTPTDPTNGGYQPLVRTRSNAQESAGESKETSDEEEIQRRISELYKRRGYSNPNPEPEDVPEQVAPTPERTGRRTRRPLQKIGKDFDPNQSYVIKHPNGSMTYVFGKSTTTTEYVSGLSPTADSSRKPSERVQYRTPPSDIVFPEDSKCNSDNPTCRDTSDYPEEYINAIVAKNFAKYESFFGTDLVNNDSVTTRFDNDDEFLCQYRERLVHPQEGSNMDEKTIMIVNTKNYTQGVRIETCENAGQPCSEFVRATTECKQFYHYRTLLAVNPKTNELYKEAIRLPSCCKCVIKTQHLKKYINP